MFDCLNQPIEPGDYVSYVNTGRHMICRIKKITAKKVGIVSLRSDTTFYVENYKLLKISEESITLYLLARGR